jgi:hypothetical protein
MMFDDERGEIMKTMITILTIVLLSPFVLGHAHATDYHAVLVGINNYSGWVDDTANLNWAVKDVDDMHDALVDHFGWESDNIEVIKNGDATKTRIQSEIASMPQTNGDDTSLFHFSGHGRSNYGLLTCTFNDYIAPSDLNNYFVGGYNQFCCILDACYSGNFTNYFNRGVICAACDFDETAPESDVFENGVYTYYIVQGITNGAANPYWIVSAENLHFFAKPLVEAYRFPNDDLHPQIADYYNGDLWLTSVLRKDSYATIQGRYTTIQQALDNASSGDTIYVNHNTYESADVTIPSNVTVRTSNKTMKFASGVDLTISGSGTLLADGSATFTKATGAASWNGITINNGGVFTLTDTATIQNATTGVTINGNSSTPINNGANTLTIQNCTTGLYNYNCSPTIGNILFSNNTSNAVEVDHLASNLTMQRSNVSDTYATNHAIYVNNAADMTLKSSILGKTADDTIFLEAAAAINTNDTNNIDHRSGYYPIYNTTASYHGYLDIRNTYWYGTTVITSIVSDYSSDWVTYSPIAGSAYTSNIGTYKPAVIAGSGTVLENARELEDDGLWREAVSVYRRVIDSAENETHKRLAFKRMVRIAGLRDNNYDDIRSLMEAELKSAEGWYRAYLDCALCDIMVREGKYNVALRELEYRSEYYHGTPVEVAMLSEMANIAGVKLGDTQSAKSYADRAASINPGQGSLRIAYAAAGMDYDPSRYENRFANASVTFGAEPKQGEEPIDSAAVPTLAITPNPANPFTTIRYTLAKPGNVSLDIYTISGQKEATLVDGAMTAGTHSALFDGTSLASGIYLYRFRTAGFAMSGKIALVK